MATQRANLIQLNKMYALSWYTAVLLQMVSIREPQAL